MGPIRTDPLPISGAHSSPLSFAGDPAGGAMLKVSENGRYFVRDGAPFFWMGDTVWSLVNRYLPDGAAFTPTAIRSPPPKRCALGES